MSRRRVRAHRIGFGLAAGLLMAAAGCAGGSDDGLDRQNVYGAVTLDGAPLARGIISFDPEGGSAGATPAGGVIIDGSYNIDRAGGPTPGKYRVSIQATDSGAGEIDLKAAPGAPPPRKKGQASKVTIPEQYNAKSTLTTEVKAATTQANFELKSK